MSEFFLQIASLWNDRAKNGLVIKAAFFITVAYAGATFWFAKHPPMVDLPGHAGQVALLHDLLTNQSPWQHLVGIQYFTPYLMGVGLAAALSLLMPVAAALKLLLMISFYAFVYLCVLLRQRFEGDDRLDWLFIPGFFGVAYTWGLFSFLIASPIGLLFVLLAETYAERPSIRRGIRLCVTGFFLFFSHGLVFIFACGIGVALLLVKRRPVIVFLTSLSAYAPLGILSIFYVLINRQVESAIPSTMLPAQVWGWTVRRLFFVFDIFGAEEKSAIIFATVAGILMLWAPRLFGSRLNLQKPSAFVPFAAMVFVWSAVPVSTIQATFVYSRFSLFILPCYALLFRKSDSSYLVSVPRSVEAHILNLMLPILCWIFLTTHAINLIQFNQESKEFDDVSFVADPGQRALTFVLDSSSNAAKHSWTYLHYPAWYQAENKGLVDFNFAYYSHQMVRYKSDLPVISPGWEYHSRPMTWNEYQGWKYRYFFVRDTQQASNSLFDNEKCDVLLLKVSGSWSIYENKGCR